MNLKKFGGEFKFIESIAKTYKDKKIIRGIGDDAAVIHFGNRYLLVSTDTIVEGDHFSLDYFSPKEVGGKAIESSISDIVAMGGKPQYVFLSLCLPKDVKVKTMKEIYQGIYQKCDKYNIAVLGGDTTHSKNMVVSVTVLGEGQKGKICFRSDAKIGDLIKVTGKLGASTAGFHFFQSFYKKNTNNSNDKSKTKIEEKKMDFVKKKHLRPQCRLDIVDKINFHANAMQDISDGLASELKHICKASKVSAIIDGEIPIDEKTHLAAQLMGQDAVNFALYGGEDFELVYTVAKKHVNKTPGVVVGKIIRSVNKKHSVFLQQGEKKILLQKSGYDHFQ